MSAASPMPEPACSGARQTAIGRLPADSRRLLLVRHGLPDYRLRKSGDELPGPPLSETGHIQARQAAETVHGYAPERIYCSPLTRTRVTAQIIQRRTGAPLQVESDLREWHRTESLCEGNIRGARWLRRWLRAEREQCAAVVGHASPLLSMMRSALYLPHFGWYLPGRPDLLRIDTCDRFEVSMASVFLLTFEPDAVTATCLAHPRPRTIAVHRGRRTTCATRPVPGIGENRHTSRRNWQRLIGY